MSGNDITDQPADAGQAQSEKKGSAMNLRGSCHCAAVKFQVVSHTPYPFMYCYCSICRKTNGGGGCCINIMGDAKTLQVEGVEHIQMYQVKGQKQGNLRHFCRLCGTHLYAWCPLYPEFVYPCASAIDTPLPEAPARVHLMLGSKASWVPAPTGEEETLFDEYPTQGIEQWHRAHGLYLE